MENYTVTKVKKTKMGKDREKETSKPPYSTIKSYSQSNTEVDTTVDDIDFTQLEESWEESNSDVNNFNSSTPKFIWPTTPNPPNTPELFQKLLEYEKTIFELEEKLNQHTLSIIHYTLYIIHYTFTLYIIHFILPLFSYLKKLILKF